MKNLLKNTIACVIVMTSCFNCSVESIENDQLEASMLESSALQLDPCSNQDPQARITNNGTVPVTLEIATIDGTILHTVVDLAPGSVSGYLTFASDDIIFNVSKNTTGITDEKVTHTMEQCMSFDMEVDTDNYLIDTVPVSL
ncbi:hypothetical protein [Psychroserpens sp. SPM9]|uniref:hypothetical protein n=1 Tax=Psychroserpens sp. SPM9 TaxID=2975598 RepID=UPI0021A712D0|nr:hypothetical protein [Psychroserpens sp. SPM9]MDG5491534.1 hypothetical protein [Psychroserpens sp. SPM9]